MKPLIVRTYRDDDLINELATNLQEAVLLIEDGVEKFNWNGLFS